MTYVSSGSNYKSQFLRCTDKAKVIIMFSPGEAYQGPIFRTDGHLLLSLVSQNSASDIDLKTRFTVRDLNLLLFISVRHAFNEKGLCVSLSAGLKKV